MKICILTNLQLTLQNKWKKSSDSKMPKSDINPEAYMQQSLSQAFQGGKMPLCTEAQSVEHFTIMVPIKINWNYEEGYLLQKFLPTAY